MEDFEIVKKYELFFLQIIIVVHLFFTTYSFLNLNLAIIIKFTTLFK